MHGNMNVKSKMYRSSKNHGDGNGHDKISC